ncbi:MAG: hypothetical protein F7C34_00820 [Desulfurococcales archaeon]|nr:hypothetical protein [Desulfurococcales archaeon]
MEDKRVEEALQKAYERLVEILHPLFSSATQFSSVTLRLDYDEKGPVKLVIEIEAPSKYFERLGVLIDEAAREAARAFEEAAGIRAGRRVRLVPIEGPREGGSGAGPQKRGSRRGGSRGRSSGGAKYLRV